MLYIYIFKLGSGNVICYMELLHLFFVIIKLSCVEEYPEFCIMKESAYIQQNKSIIFMDNSSYFLYNYLYYL